MLGSLHEVHRRSEHRGDEGVPVPSPFTKFLRRQDVQIEFPADHFGHSGQQLAQPLQPDGADHHQVRS
jgi:hypothetical protein